MLILPYGITGGYYYKGQEPDRPSVDKDQFVKRCQQVAAKHGMRTEVYEHVWGNFYAIMFDGGDKPFFAVLNKFHPYMAFADYDLFGQFGSGFPLHYIDFPEIARDFAGEYRVLTTEELAKEFHLVDQPELRFMQSIREQVDYYKPTTFGDVIFNCWDA